jgi:signal transduction histidine kinase
VETGDAERRRLERNLHDGAQQRLVALSLTLRMCEDQLAKIDPFAVELVRRAEAELAAALEELRELARGIHPAILTERGLVAALQMLAGRASIPVELSAELDERLPPPVEAAAYYIVAEALTNASKHADAERVRVDVQRANGEALVEVSDDGVGGADRRRGSGLRGLGDRVEALGGRLEVESPLGAGTLLRARLPVGRAP